MASAQVVETSVPNNSPSQDSNHLVDLFQSRYDIIFVVFFRLFVLRFLSGLAFHAGLEHFKRNQKDVFFHFWGSLLSINKLSCEKLLEMASFYFANTKLSWERVLKKRVLFTRDTRYFIKNALVGTSYSLFLLSFDFCL